MKAYTSDNMHIVAICSRTLHALCIWQQSVAMFSKGHGDLQSSRKHVVVIVLRAAAGPDRMAAITTGRGKKYPR